MRSQARAYLLLVALAAIWGASFLFIKIGLGSVTPLTIAAGRIGVAAIVLYAVLRGRGMSLPAAGRHWIFIVAAALFGNVLPFSLVSFGERQIDSSLAAILMATIPLFTILIAHFITSDEKLTSAKVIGVGIGLAGIVILLGPAALMELGNQTFAQLLVACGAAFYALSGILSRNLRDLPKLQSSAAILLVASLFIVPAALIIDRPWMLVPDGSAIGAIVVLGLLSTALAQIIVLGILQLRDASFLSLNNYFVPLFGVFWGVPVLAERPGPNTAIAFLVILAGVFVSQGGLRLLVRRRSRA
jgi:drug/metabolite transporter (DMT)-like permease